MMPPQRHWRSYGTDPLPTAAEALQQPFAAFPSWFLKITCDRCGKDRMLDEAHATERQRDMPMRALRAVEWRLRKSDSHRHHDTVAAEGQAGKQPAMGSASARNLQATRQIIKNAMRYKENSTRIVVDPRDRCSACHGGR